MVTITGRRRRHSRRASQTTTPSCWTACCVASKRSRPTSTPSPSESAGKRKAARTTKGPRWLKTVLIEGAHAVAKSKGTYLSERYRQLARRRGSKKAIVAVAHDILSTVWQLLSTGQTYREAGSESVLSTAEELAKNGVIRRLQSLGYSVTLR